MNLLLTGGAGFIGSHAVRYALTNGFTVINVDKLTYAGNLNNLEDCFNHNRYFFYQEDICNGKAMQSLFQRHKPDLVLHMAAESHVDRSIDSSELFVKTNVMGTHVLLESALAYHRHFKKESFRFLHVSTDEVFGSLENGEYFHENRRYQPNSPYAASKAASDLLVRSYYQTYGLPIMIVNVSNNYGPNQYPEKLIPLTILNALENKPLPIYGDGKQIRDWLYVEDNIEALFSLLHFGGVGESYCVGANNEFSNLDLVLLICDYLESLSPCSMSYRDLVTFVQDRPGHDRRYATNAEKVQAHTGWKPKMPFKEGLLKTIQWYLMKAESFKENNEARLRLGLPA